MLEISLKAEVEAVEKKLSRLENRQLPFVTAVTLTRLAEESRDANKDEMSRVFNLRSDWMQKGVKINSANKKDFKTGKIHSRVFDKDSYMTIHTEGGTRRPEKHKNISIPSEEYEKTGIRTSRGPIKSGKKPKALIQRIKATKLKRRKKKRGGYARNKPFAAKTKYGQLFIAVRQTNKPFPLNYLYFFHKGVTIRKVWPFSKTVRDIVTGRFPAIFKSEMKKALR